MPDNITGRDNAQQPAVLRTTESGGVHTPHHHVSSLPTPHYDALTAIVNGLTGVANAIAARLGTLGQKNAAGSAPVVLASDQPAVPVSLAGVATQVTLEALRVLFADRIATLGQKAMAASMPVTLANDQSPLRVGADSALDPAWAASISSIAPQTLTIPAAVIARMNEVWMRIVLLDQSTPAGKWVLEGSVDGVNWDPILRPDSATVYVIIANVLIAPAATAAAGVTITGNEIAVVGAMTGDLVLIIPFDSPPPGGVRARWVPQSGGAAGAISGSYGVRGM